MSPEPGNGVTFCAQLSVTFSPPSTAFDGGGRTAKTGVDNDPTVFSLAAGDSVTLTATPEDSSDIVLRVDDAVDGTEICNHDSAGAGGGEARAIPAAGTDRIVGVHVDGAQGEITAPVDLALHP